MHPSDAEVAEIKKKMTSQAATHKEKLKRRRSKYAKKHGLDTEPDPDDEDSDEGDEETESLSSLSSPRKRDRRPDDDDSGSGSSPMKRRKQASGSSPATGKQSSDTRGKGKGKKTATGGKSGATDTQIIVAKDYTPASAPTVLDLFGEINDISTSSSSGNNATALNTTEVVATVGSVSSLTNML